MKRVLALAALLLSSLPALAATQEEAANAPAPTVDVVYVVIFIVGFIAVVGGFFAYYFFYGADEENKDKK